MRPKRMTPPVRRTTRRWRTPPAITHGTEAFEGSGILDEIRGPLGLLLWQTLRDVTLWASFEPEEREGIFVAGADEARMAAVRGGEVDVQIEPPLMTVVRMVGNPHGARPETVSMACQHIAHWADGQGLTATAIAFAQAAALSIPFDAGAAYAVGRLARRRAEYARAETWFRRSIALARQSGDWTSYALAFSGLGNLYAQRGNYPAARRFHVRTLRAARRHSLRQIQGAALHDLFVIASNTGQEDAERYARGAYDAYGHEHARLPALAQDIAWFWMERGHFEPALTVFQALLPHMHRFDERLVVLSNVVRAAAGAGERRLFEETWDEVWDGLSRSDTQENAAQVLVEMAHGASMMGEPERAERAAERALAVATQRGESKIR
ncbi:MAG TPA: tetratricopeptide repeat protein, partial [Longimicrobiaceae bacterium]|nr:tetratricopeptide repeat protein [Longimicrobiaceae bacterium]